MTLGVMGIGEQGRCGISCVQSSYNWLHSIGSITGFIGLLGSWNYWSHGILFMVDVVNVRSCFRHVLLNSDWGGVRKNILSGCCNRNQVTHAGFLSAGWFRVGSLL